MSLNEVFDEPPEQEKDVIKEEINIQAYWHAITFFSTYIGSYVIPGIIFFTYILLLFYPYVLNTSNIITLFTNPISLITFLIIPIIVVLCYLLHLFFTALITRYWWGLAEKRVPTKDGIIPRNIPSKTLNYYHIRSFMIKYPKNAFVKGIFPWLSNWMFNFVRTNKIGKDTVIEEQVCGDKYIEVGDNCYIGVNSILTSHLVEGIFGNISYFKLKIGNNVTMACGNAIAPGSEFNDNAYLLPLASVGKFNIAKGDNYYFGIPLRRIFKKKTMEYLQLTKEDLERDKTLKEQMQQLFKEI